MSEKHLRNGSTLPALKPGVIRLYSMRYCPFAQRARLVLAHKNIPHEIVNIHLKDKPDWFLLKNPQGTVPVVEVDDKVIYESTAVCEWLDDVHADNHLQQSDPYIKAWDRILLEYFGKVGSAFYSLLLKSEEIDKVAEELAKHYKYYEGILTKRGGPYFGGKNPTMIDFYLWPAFERLQAFGTRHTKIYIDKSNYPSLSKWIETISTFPAVKKTSADTKSLLHFMDSVPTGTPDYDDGLN